MVARQSVVSGSLAAVRSFSVFGKSNKYSAILIVEVNFEGSSSATG
jgi:hypothetical protein